MGVKNTMKVADSALGKVNPKYDLTQKNWIDIVESSGNLFDAAKNGFRFGYMQGVKAARAERRAK